MITSKKNLIVNVGLILLILLMASCQDERTTVLDNTSIQFTANYSDGLNGGRILVGDVQLEDFMIFVEEIELEADDDSPNNNGSSGSGNTNDDDNPGSDDDEDDKYADLEWKGPFELTLLQNGQPMNIPLPSGDLPNKKYKELEVEFIPNPNSSSAMYGHSLHLTGSIDGTPFIFWSDQAFEWEIEFPTEIGIEDVRSTLIKVQFELQRLIDPAQGGIDLSQVKDGNGNGIIEIGPGDPDGNNQIFSVMIEKLRDFAHAERDDD
ncbi:MAG: hypothetical protein LPK28_06280 [Bacteroidota bacterium]|nr:hypothetical protein [Bacteroidota bacterium]